MVDNNENGHLKKIQRFGSSNRFVKVTGRTIRNCILCQDIIGEENDKRVTVTYVDQKIMNPINFPIFEKENVNLMNMDGVNNCLLRSGPFDGSVERLDLTGNRVNIYTELIDLTNTIQFTVLKMLTGYVASKDRYKRWRHQPDHHFNDKRKALMSVLHKETPNLRQCTAFQQNIVNQWNPESQTASSLIIPPVSLRDEIRTNRYGMAIIEILCMAGLLLHITSQNGME